MEQERSSEVLNKEAATKLQAFLDTLRSQYGSEAAQYALNQATGKQSEKVNLPNQEVREMLKPEVAKLKELLDSDPDLPYACEINLHEGETIMGRTSERGISLSGSPDGTAGGIGENRFAGGRPDYLPSLGQKSWDNNSNMLSALAGRVGKFFGSNIDSKSDALVLIVHRKLRHSIEEIKELGDKVYGTDPLAIILQVPGRPDKDYGRHGPAWVLVGIKRSEYDTIAAALLTDPIATINTIIDRVSPEIKQTMLLENIKRVQAKLTHTPETNSRPEQIHPKMEPVVIGPIVNP